MKNAAGQWIGWGLGDDSPTVLDMKRHLRRKFSYAAGLTDTTVYDQLMVDVVRIMQVRYGIEPHGRMDYATQLKCGYANPAVKPKPVIFTVEGHMSNMFVGPAYATARALEERGLVTVQPIGYLNTALPFRSQTGIDEVVRFLCQDALDNGTPFPLGTPWGMCGFSEGSIVIGRAFMEHIRPEHGRAHHRLADLKRVIAFGDPLRGLNRCAPWVPDPPKRNTRGIAPVCLEDPPDYWQSHSRTGDMYSENPDTEVGLDRSAVYKIVAESKWSGGEAGMWERILDIIRDPADGLMDVALAIAGGVKFLTDMSPHGAYDLDPCIEYMRGVAA